MENTWNTKTSWNKGTNLQNQLQKTTKSLWNDGLLLAFRCKPIVLKGFCSRFLPNIHFKMGFLVFPVYIYIYIYSKVFLICPGRPRGVRQTCPDRNICILMPRLGPVLGRSWHALGLHFGPVVC